MEPKFKVGDRVKGIYHAWKSGWTGTIIKTDDKKFIVDFDTHHDGSKAHNNPVTYYVKFFDEYFVLDQAYINERKIKKLLGID